MVRSCRGPSPGLHTGDVSLCLTGRSKLSGGSSMGVDPIHGFVTLLTSPNPNHLLTSSRGGVGLQYMNWGEHDMQFI